MTNIVALRILRIQSLISLMLGLENTFAITKTPPQQPPSFFNLGSK